MAHYLRLNTLKMTELRGAHHSALLFLPDAEQALSVDLTVHERYIDPYVYRYDRQGDCENN